MKVCTEAYALSTYSKSSLSQTIYTNGLILSTKVGVCQAGSLVNKPSHAKLALGF